MYLAVFYRCRLHHTPGIACDAGPMILCRNLPLFVSAVTIPQDRRHRHATDATDYYNTTEMFAASHS